MEKKKDQNFYKEVKFYHFTTVLLFFFFLEIFFWGRMIMIMGERYTCQSTDLPFTHGRESVRKIFGTKEQERN